MSQIKLEDVTKTFGDVVAADSLNITVESGQLFTLLGPSGCGKTTTLRIVGGFEQPDTGDVYLGDRVVTNEPPANRDTAMVFQNYAIWPHKTVFENVAYGLKIRGFSRQTTEEKIGEVLELVGLTKYEDRHPGQLSGGQQQRVALARSLAVEPSVLLMDEPLGNLDAKLRKEMRVEVRRLQQRLEITMIWVTHDQQEALAISDKLAVMQHGKIVQIDTPFEIYNNPQNLFVAEFLSNANIYECVVESISNGTVMLRTPNDLALESQVGRTREFSEGDRVFASINPQAIQLNHKAARAQSIDVRVENALFTGPFAEYHVKAESGDRLTVHLPLTGLDRMYEPGEQLSLSIDKRIVNMFSRE